MEDDLKIYIRKALLVVCRSLLKYTWIINSEVPSFSPHSGGQPGIALFLINVFLALLIQVVSLVAPILWLTKYYLTFLSFCLLVQANNKLEHTFNILLGYMEQILTIISVHASMECYFQHCVCRGSIIRSSRPPSFYTACSKLT